MDKLLALTLAAALVLGLAATPANAAQSLGQTVRYSESRRSPQPSRPSPAPSVRPPARPQGNRPPAPQPSHKPAPAPSRPGPSHSYNNKRGPSTAAKIGLGVVVGALIGTAIVHAVR